MFEIASEFESVAYRVIDELLRQHIKVHAYRSVSSDSIYIKLDAGVCGSVRVSDHRGKEKLKYKFNVDLSLSKQTRYVTHKMGYTRFYYSSDNLNLMFSDIAEVRANKMEQYGLDRYESFVERNIEDSNRKKGFWAHCTLVRSIDEWRYI